MVQRDEHRSVLFDEALIALRILPDGRYIDGTFGRGGHSGAILRALGAKGRLLALDKDPDAIGHGRSLFADDERVRLIHGSFAELERLAQQLNWSGKVDGILLDLGVSSPQLDQAQRGFSFSSDGPLDMRMDNTAGETAADWLAYAEREEIADIIKAYGEERFAKRIAAAIVAARASVPIVTTGQLADIVTAAVPMREKGKHPATRSFQAIRIHVNRELDDLRRCMQQSIQVLAPSGRLVVISFHSLEDRMVKRFIRDAVRGDRFPPGVPVPQAALRPKLRAVGKALRPTQAEIESNPRARSAIMRAAERLA